ncbi:hypothetical protein GCM10027413_31990 [Conyzicola nivalis]|uniref:Peptidase S8/S53 domain-containing protein n=1 Tax=Conyzicola nivalis TaxID=1477021 RepID=A0A916WKX8_9MICO|nr:S8 family serine peptidase [Conyzicola nivalis]GGB11708.1 hypothetical protein GCM10010979_27530 [Conyzicola nivalis]
MSSLRALSRTLAVAGAVALLAITAAPAHAVDAPWYVGALKLDTAAQGLTGAGVKIAVLDGPINPEVPTLVGADLQVQEPSLCFDDTGTPLPAATTDLGPSNPTDHGTNVASIIVGSGAGYAGQQGVVGVAPGATILYYSVYSESAEGEGVRCRAEDGSFVMLPIHRAIDAAVDAGANIISVSLEHAGSDEFDTAIARAFREGVVVVASLPNDASALSVGGMPADANGTVGVQAAGADGSIQNKASGQPNRDTSADVVAPGLDISVQGNPATGLWSDQFVANGTSLATPLTAGVLALVMEKYPAATGNQIIQSLIHNTSGDPDHEPARDPDELIGYGLLSPTNLLSVDPTKYDDVNPLILKEAADGSVLEPTYDQIFNTAATDEPAGEPDAEAESSGTPAWVGILVGVLIGGVVLVAIVVTVIIMAVRKRAAITKQ